MLNALREKATSKVNNCLIEITGYAPKDFLVKHRLFKVLARTQFKWTPVASVSQTLAMTWFNDDLMSDDVKEAVDECIADLE